MALEALKQARRFVTGAKQTIKAVENGTAQKVYLARDAEARVTLPIVRACEAANIDIAYVDNMIELGRACGIKVGAAAAAILKE